MSPPREIPPHRRGTWHYVCRPQYRTQNAMDWTPDLAAALSGWIGDALTGNKAHRLAALSTPSINRDADDIRCDIAHALTTAVEWDGFSLAHELKLRGWPADVALVQLCNVWSCGLSAKIRAQLAARKPNLNPANSL